ncbi:hypothetical protein J8I26_21845 [Herbaspirillum sp. LeCh32-8]|nr:hypothetical protein [Herbaspirillum sp. LeCh32-8]MBP0600768.1 hypothetical protein [Herbaspirillum sp. LeCh32-8]
MNVPEQINLMCRRCGSKEGLRAPASALWHYATCIKCRYKQAVTEQVKAA